MTIEADDGQEMRASVIVIGAGPAGLSTALTLARLGIDVLVVTKHAGTANSPRAHITNQRTMEVFRALGIEERVREVAIPNALMGNNVWSSSFAAPEIARLSTWGTGARQSDYDAASPCPMCNIGQHLLEPILLDAALASGARVSFRSEFLGLEQDEDGVAATVIDRDTGAKRIIRGDYLVGADGGNSLVAQSVGIGIAGQMGLGRAVNAWLEVDLTRYCEHRPSVLYWMLRPGNDYWVGSGTWICVKPWTEWVLLFMYDPADGEPDTSDAAIIARARQTIGDPDIPVRVKAISTWQINHALAECYRAGRVFLAGDAAHRHPPANGLGSNTSVQDGFNLGWKLAWVLTGKARPALLDSYEAERRPVGRQVVDRAMKSVVDMTPIAESLGFRPGQTEADGWAAMAELGEATGGGAERRRLLDDAVALQNYQFNAHGVELGQTYRSAAVASEPDEVAPPRDAELYYTPSTAPGRALPHAWLVRDGAPVSTLDLCALDGFTLVTGIDGGRWRDAAAAASAGLGIAITIVEIGHGQAVLDPSGAWARLRQVDESGCILVRPDRFVVWRSTGLPADAATTLRDVLAGLLGYSGASDTGSNTNPPTSGTWGGQS